MSSTTDFEIYITRLVIILWNNHLLTHDAALYGRWDKDDANVRTMGTMKFLIIRMPVTNKFIFCDHVFKKIEKKYLSFQW